MFPTREQALAALESKSIPRAPIPSGSMVGGMDDYQFDDVDEDTAEAADLSCFWCVKHPTVEDAYHVCANHLGRADCPDIVGGYAVF